MKFQPRQAAFQTELGSGVRDALEAALHTRSALSVGDWLSLEAAGAAFDLRVLELQPSTCVSVIGELFSCLLLSFCRALERWWHVWMPSVHMSGAHNYLCCAQGNSGQTILLTLPILSGHLPD